MHIFNVQKLSIVIFKFKCVFDEAGIMSIPFLKKKETSLEAAFKQSSFFLLGFILRRCIEHEMLPQKMFSCGNYGFKTLYIICAVAGFGLPKKNYVFCVIPVVQFCQTTERKMENSNNFFFSATTDLKYQNFYICCLWNLSVTFKKIMI